MLIEEVREFLLRDASVRTLKESGGNGDEGLGDSEAADGIW